MGDFKITIHAVGGHGCQRTAKAGEEFYGCGLMNCPDCLASEFVKKLAESSSVTDATLTHWPSSMSATHGIGYTEDKEVVDDLNVWKLAADTYTKIRSARLRKRVKGSF
jgi:hypothetical protein